MALQQLPDAVQARRCAELPAVLRKPAPSKPQQRALTMLEVALHTQKLQVTLHSILLRHNHIYCCWATACDRIDSGLVQAVWL